MPYLYNRTARMVPGGNVEAMAWALTMTETVNAVGDLEVNLWTNVLSRDIGTLGWTAVLGNLAEVVALEEKLGADEGYLALAEEGARFVNADGLHDGLVKLIHADPDGLDTAQYASITTTVVAPGATATGMALGVEMAQYIKTATGCPVSFGSSMTGRFGEVGWILLADSVDGIQAADDALSADAGWVTMLDERATTAFVRSESDRRMTRKLA